MLILTRQKDEFITLRHKATGAILGRVGVCEIRDHGKRITGCKVRIGLELHDSIEIVRDELLDGWRGRAPTPGSESLNGRTNPDGQRAAG